MYSLDIIVLKYLGIQIKRPNIPIKGLKLYFCAVFFTFKNCSVNLSLRLRNSSDINFFKHVTEFLRRQIRSNWVCPLAAKTLY